MKQELRQGGRFSLNIEVVFMKYVYPAVIEYEEGIGYGVYFPDVEGAITSGKTLYEALEMAEDALCSMLTDWEDAKAGKHAIVDGVEIPMTNKITSPTPIEKVVPEPVKYASKVFVTLVKADTDLYRAQLKAQGLE